MKIPFIFSVPMAVAMAAAGCSSAPTDTPSAQAVMQPTQGQSARGVVTFTQKREDVLVVASFSGLTPGGHGFHIHEKGDCSAPDATSAGGHFNPAAKKHGHPHHGEHHSGDLPMLQADASGNASLTVTLSGISLRPDSSTNIVGRGLIVHAAPDDYQTQPTGNAGARVACGIITVR